MVIVLDGCGVGGAPDAARFGDAGSNTLGNVAAARARVGTPLAIDHLVEWGLGRVVGLADVVDVADEQLVASRGRMRELGCAKDTTAGHWEMMGLIIDRPFPTYPDGFPDALVEEISAAAGHELMGNEVASGTEIVARLGGEAVRREALILYTSADSVFQLAAHEDVIPVDELYRVCAVARVLLTGQHGVGRVIARPFIGREGAYVRTSRRRDFSLPPTGTTVIDSLAEAGVPVLGVGKVGEVFTCRGFSDSTHTEDNDAAVDLVIEHMRSTDGGALVFANLGDFDTLWGHRNDVAGFAGGVEAFSRRLAEVMGAARPGDTVVVTADHGCDPTTPSTDHSREDVPLLVWRRDPGSDPPGPATADLGTRYGFCDLGATVAEALGVGWHGPGRSFWREVSGVWT